MALQHEAFGSEACADPCDLDLLERAERARAAKILEEPVGHFPKEEAIEDFAQSVLIPQTKATMSKDLPEGFKCPGVCKIGDQFPGTTIVDSEGMAENIPLNCPLLAALTGQQKNGMPEIIAGIEGDI